MRLIFLFFIISIGFLKAQNDSIKKMNFSLIGEVYYSFDFSRPPENHKVDFIYNHKRHNEANLNLLLGKMTYLDENFRSNIGLMVGNYAKYNLETEPMWAKPIYEANAGVKLSKNNDLWLDAGVMPSHIGYESPLEFENITLTNDISTENTPFYQTGMRVAYTNSTGKFYASGLLLNGWQRIKRIDGIRTPSLGMQFSYYPNEKWVLNYSNYFGKENDPMHNFRMYHDFFARYMPNESWTWVFGLDIGVQNKIWYSPVITSRYKFNQHHAIAFGTEFFDDPYRNMIKIGTEGNHIFGLSTNYDWRINRNFLFRVEAKYYAANHGIFNGNTQNLTLSSSLSFRL